MALISCPECSQTISNKAKSCPHCGFPIDSKVIEWDIKKEEKELKQKEKEDFLDSVDDIRYAKRGTKTPRKNFHIFLIVVALFVVLLIWIANDSTTIPKYKESAKTSSTTENQYHSVKYPTVKLNIRQEPNTKSKVIKTLKTNEGIYTGELKPNGFIAILNDDNSILDWCASKYLQSSPVEIKKNLEKKEKINPIKYTIYAKEDISFASDQRMVYRVQLDVEIVPEESELKIEAKKIWNDGNKQWDEFTIFFYLPDMDKNGSAYGIGEFTSNGLKSFKSGLGRKAGTKITKPKELESKSNDKAINTTIVNEHISFESLKISKTYSISKETPLMPELEPKDPLNAMEKVIYLKTNTRINILSISRIHLNPWYEVSAKNKMGDFIGKGWINSTALMRQNIEQISDAKAEKKESKELNITNANKTSTAKQTGTPSKVKENEKISNKARYVQKELNGWKYTEVGSISVSKRQKIFYDIVKYQDDTGDDDGARTAIAKRYSIPTKAINAIAIEGALKKWPMPDISY